MDIASWLSNFNMFNVAATAAGVWVFVSNWWVMLLLGFVWLVSRSKTDKHKGTPKHLPTKTDVVNWLFDLYVK
jgi:hypothetical protein